MLQALLEMLIGLVALIAAAALSQFGVDLNLPGGERREVHRVTDCGDKPTTTPAAFARTEHQDC